MITLYPLYLAVGAWLLFCAWRSLRGAGASARQRISSGLFWAILGVLFLVGERLPSAVVGGLVIGLAVLSALGGARPGAAAPRDDRSTILTQNRSTMLTQSNRRLFLPALLIPFLTLLGVLLLKPLRVRGALLFEPNGATLLCLALGCAVGLGVALRSTGQRLAVALAEGSRLLEIMGWAATLPLLLATLGGVFAAAGAGSAVAELLRALLPLQHRAVAVAAYGIGMALFTVIMGNAFAAFPVLTAGIGVPLLVRLHHADPAPLGALGMLSGYCGTLLTPMAANFNLVPAALLELRDPYAVIRAQAATALLLLGCNLVLMNLVLFR
jgi:uncharacterized membrane protein